MRVDMRSVGRAFVCGGAICLVVQAVMIALGGVMPPALPMAARAAAALLICGAVTGVLVATGVWERINAFGGMGANLPFIGLVPAVAGLMCGAVAEGGSIGAGVARALKAMAVLFGIGLTFGALCAIVTAALGIGIYG